MNQIHPDELTVDVKNCCQGGGTGEEFKENLLIPGDSAGNKWYDPNPSETWIKLILE